jgi:hypothetical protein
MLQDLGFEYCYHITPIHYLPSILRERSLLSKAALQSNSTGVALRPSSERIDTVLGFTNFVHTFPIRNLHRTISTQPTAQQIPILGDKLGLGYPHVCLRLPIHLFSSQRPTLCWWNAAKGHPNGCCGSWQPERIKQEWVLHRENGLPLIRTKGFFNDPVVVPTVINCQQLSDLIHAIGENAFKKRLFELLATERLHITEEVGIEVFSMRDYDLVQRIGLATGFQVTFVDPTINNYNYSSVTPHWNAIEEYYSRNADSPIPTIPFD